MSVRVINSLAHSAALSIASPTRMPGTPGRAAGITMAFARPTIAIVDDDLILTSLLRDFLEDAGYRVLSGRKPTAHRRCCAANSPTCCCWMCTWSVRGGPPHSGVGPSGCGDRAYPGHHLLRRRAVPAPQSRLSPRARRGGGGETVRHRRTTKGNRICTWPSTLTYDAALCSARSCPQAAAMSTPRE